MMWERLITIAEFEEAARAVLPRTAYDYYRSGADAERTLSANQRAFTQYEIWYRVLVDVARRDLDTELFGERVSFPVIIAPTAYHKLAHPDGEIATAKAAEAAGTIYTLSTLATTSIEDVAAASAGPKWFQLYVHKDRELTRSLIKRAEASGYKALVLTVDAPVLGRRIADERNVFALPEGLSMANLVGALGDAESAEERSALARYVASRHDPSLSWDDLAWIRELSKLPLLLKGVVRPDDALLAVQHGVAGIIVSNHGGRQLDDAPATLDALPGIVRAVGDRCPVLLDGGVRWGTDVLKALALGARAVLIGRPVLWGLAIGGELGVHRVLEILRGELSIAMALAGVTRISEIDGELVKRRGSQG